MMRDDVYRETDMLEGILTVGSSAAWLPTAEAAEGGGTICTRGVQVAIHNGRSKYLPFAKNAINAVESEGQDVVSFNFTGCLMAAFKYQGRNMICHVSTGNGQDCKAEWQNIKRQSVNVFEFRPSDFIDTRGGAFYGCYGLITNDLRTYAVTVVSDKAGAKTVAAITMARLLR